jgi:NAD(P)-dependent dehydrogenase (short-subunit alcohol dehydrogenase family)
VQGKPAEDTGDNLMNLNLAGQVVVVTGATANIGRATALDFAAEGAKVFAAGRDEEAGARLVSEALSRGAQAAISPPTAPGSSPGRCLRSMAERCFKRFHADGS